MPLYPFLVLEVGSGSQVPTFRNPTHLDPEVGPTKNLGVRQLCCCRKILPWPKNLTNYLDDN
jgi:hypothetical protein